MTREGEDMATEDVRGFTVRTDLAYDCQRHMWVDTISPERVRVGMDPLGLETAGTLAQLELAPPGTAFSRGDHFGSLEAEKFVGPLVAPLSGTVTAVNEPVMGDPAIVERDPFGAGWMIELAPVSLDQELSLLTRGREDVIETFEAKIEEYRRDGVLAE